MKHMMGVGKLVVAMMLVAGGSAVAQGYGGPQYGGPQGPPPGQGGPGGPWRGGGPQQGPDTLHVNQSLMRGDSLYSRNGIFRLMFQPDGNLVLTKRDGRVLWASGTDRRPGVKVLMQDDGNVVMYTRRNEPVWSTGITGPQMRHHQELILQDDGNLVVYSAGRVYWASGTNRR